MNQETRDLIRNAIIIIIISLVTFLFFFQGYMDTYVHPVNKKFCMDNNYSKMASSNLRSVYCVKWFNITLSGKEHSIKQDDIYYMLNNGSWVLIESYQHGWDTWKEGDIT